MVESESEISSFGRALAIACSRLARLIDLLKPDVLVKGADYPEREIVGGDMVKSWGGRVVRARLVPLQSTTRLVQRSAIGTNVAVAR